MIPILIDRDVNPEVHQKKVGHREGEAALDRAVAAQVADQSQKAVTNLGAETTTEIDVIDHQALTLTNEGREGLGLLLGEDTTIEGEMTTGTEGDTGMKGDEGPDHLLEEGQDHHREDTRDLPQEEGITGITMTENEEDRQSQDEIFV